MVKVEKRCIEKLNRYVTEYKELTIATIMNYFVSDRKSI